MTIEKTNKLQQGSRSLTQEGRSHHSALKFHSPPAASPAELPNHSAIRLPVSLSILPAGPVACGCQTAERVGQQEQPSPNTASHTASQHDTGARQPKASSDNKNLALPAQAGKPGETPGLGTVALVNVAEDVRDLGTRGKGKGGLERVACPVSLTEQPSSSDGIKLHRAPGGSRLFSKAES